jgi:hypothetical protein
MRTSSWILGVAMLAACASAKRDQAPAREAREVVTGGARIRGGGVRMDVEVGHGIAPRRTNGAGTRLEPGAVVNP